MVMGKYFLIFVSIFLFCACADENAGDTMPVLENGFLLSLRSGGDSARADYRTLDVFLLKVIDGRPDSTSVQDLRFWATEPVVLKDLEQMDYCVYAVANLDTSVFSVRLGDGNLVDINRRPSSMELPELMVGKTTIDSSQGVKAGTLDMERFVGGVKVIIKNRAQLSGVERIVVEIENACSRVDFDRYVSGGEMPVRIPADEQLHYCFPTYGAARGCVLLYLTGQDTPEKIPFYCENKVKVNKKLELSFTVKLLPARSTAMRFAVGCEDEISAL